MKKSNERIRRFWLGALGTLLLAGLVACEKKKDPSAATSGGGASIQRNVLTMKGAAR